MSNRTALAECLPGISPAVYNGDDFAAVAGIVYKNAGIVLSSGKAMLVYSRLAPLVRAAGSNTFGNYVELVRGDSIELAHMVAALTTNHTFFYREAHHFEHFASEVRPRLIEDLNNRRAVRIWSAGCSSGEETWSLVMSLLGSDSSLGKRLVQRDLRVLASDIAPHAINRAMGASYPAKDLDAVPADLRKQWMRPSGNDLVMADEARSIVRFRHLNLLEPWPMSGKFQAIFCRNVMIYFDNSTKERLVSRFAQALEPGGFLYIGHSERVTGAACELLSPVGPTIYVRTAG